MTAREHEDLVERLAALPDRVAGLNEKALRRRLAEGEWSIKEICGPWTRGPGRSASR
jgi:hypothetical protein